MKYTDLTVGGGKGVTNWNRFRVIRFDIAAGQAKRSYCSKHAEAGNRVPRKADEAWPNICEGWARPFHKAGSLPRRIPGRACRPSGARPHFLMYQTSLYIMSGDFLIASPILSSLFYEFWLPTIR